MRHSPDSKIRMFSANKRRGNQFSRPLPYLNPLDHCVRENRTIDQKKATIAAMASELSREADHQRIGLSTDYALESRTGQARHDDRTGTADR